MSKDSSILDRQLLGPEDVEAGIPVIFYRPGQHAELDKHYGVITAVEPQERFFRVRDLLSGTESEPFTFSSSADSPLARQSMHRVPAEELRLIVDDHRRRLEGEVANAQGVLAEATQVLEFFERRVSKLSDL